MGKAAAAIVALAAVTAILAGCTSDPTAEGHPSVTSTQLRTQVLSSARQLVQRTGMHITYAVFDYTACDSQSSAFRGQVIAAFDTPATDEQTAAEVARWISQLRPHGWQVETSAEVHSGVVVTDKHVLATLRTLADPTGKIRNLEVYGTTCIPLPYELTIQDPENVLTQLR